MVAACQCHTIPSIQLSPGVFLFPTHRVTRVAPARPTCTPCVHHCRHCEGGEPGIKRRGSAALHAAHHRGGTRTPTDADERIVLE